MTHRQATLEATLEPASPSRHAAAGVERSPDEILLRERSELSPEEQAALEQLAWRYGNAAESYLVVEPDGQCLLLPDLQGAVAIFRHKCRKHVHVPGGLLASDENKPRLIEALKTLAATHRTVNCYSIREEDLPFFEAAGFQITKFGEEPVLDLGRVSWSGKDYEWVRRQANFCRRNGVICQEVNPQELPPAEWEAMKAELHEILHDDLEGRPFPHQLALLEGRLYPDHLGRRRLFIARKRDQSQLEAFLIANPLRDGREWAFELYRKRKDSTRGVMPYLMKSVIDLMQEEGVEQVDLCMVPGKGTATPSHPRESRLVRFGVDNWYRRLDFFMNFQGQFYFKSRFRPRMINRYVCVTPRASLFSVLSFLRTVGAFSVNYRNLMRAIWQDLRGKRSSGD